MTGVNMVGYDESERDGQGPEHVGLVYHGKEFRFSMSVIGNHGRLSKQEDQLEYSSPEELR